MFHVNSRDGFTIAVSENKQLARIANSIVLSDSAFSIVVPLLALQEWEKARTDRVTITERLLIPTEAVA